MYEILEKHDHSPVTKEFKVYAPRIASKARAGQFVIVIPWEKGERVPLTIADFSPEEGWITLVFLVVGKSTKFMARMNSGDRLYAVVGPLGKPSEIERYGTVVCVGGGLGIAPIYPIARELRNVGNYVISIIGARTKELLFWEDKIRSVSDELIVCTDDGSYGRQGVVTVPLKELLESGRKIDVVWAIGPAIMMKFCSLTTKPFGVKTIVSLNPIMVDGTGMCGACRVEVDGQTRFACVDGPEFDGHKVDWDLLMARQRLYCDQEKLALDLFEKQGAEC
ncbi:MAG: sulfide/dihydroorotate dehydrogenase-like FAD/NAD-binding protein [Anaerolineae bacterium]|nr:sulfide/dihydroorotate dehydrogenase-like FAD/NAD-binding protein [Anaerolineae bacterium]MDW8102872.1 sulfide/dihydroorotate dehydrogenase-like FAD/NAD-binding protein [Anaerolineae bacterium]